MDKGYKNARVLMSEDEMGKILEKLTEEIYEKNKAEGRLLVVGIKRRGEILAKRIVELLGTKIDVAFGSLDITLYRDDLTSIDKKPIVRKTEIPFNIDDRSLLLVDDVLFTGRTIRAALTELVDLGRPKRVELAVFIDRGERELPICPDFVGKSLEVDKSEMVEVRLHEIDEEECVLIVPR
ncbi:bifunctional pyr operon transcriptional regulator/uracil phosphoribosyltransferase [candidate division WOR-3 bacterium JGI_Cruoil_03_44_89]|uniref:Bifunctional protein PyrR n=1 Tax=candidate division WOR-3 bacterium JGI_Cruoil_03_44_89 TaxID=1973748 RepID=A0A235BRQ8_UNCW3|nr:MAG: bifunctional pyr operon transcriptional regulator/uracil phosphoribosyltransferase [candidate division WOR-3 bacterium JGI_Cruoil_03_44_89]